MPKTDHLVASSDEDGDGARVVALLNDQHAFLGGAERQLTHDARLAQLLLRQLLKARHDAPACCYGDQLQQITLD